MASGLPLLLLAPLALCLARDLHGDSGTANDSQLIGRRRRHPAALIAQSASEHREGEEVPVTDVRPNIGSGADMIQFGILIKSVWGIDYPKNVFTADIVLTLQWNDERTKALVPDGVPTVTLSQAAAEQAMWLPDITITNRKIGGLEVISSSFAITNAGQVTKTARVIARIDNQFDMHRFPFDKQKLTVKIASTSLMSDELKLVPMKGEDSGVAQKVLDGSESALLFKKEVPIAYDAEDGPLRKSRGELVVTAVRDWGVYLRRKMLPQSFLVAISWTVFYLPLKPPFAMPRVATSLISFLALLTLTQKSQRGGGESWMDCWEEACVNQLFLTNCLNIFVALINFSLDLNNVAEVMDNHLKIFLPTLTFLVSIILVLGGPVMGMELVWLKVITRILIVIAPVTYVTWCIFHFPEIKAKIMEKHRQRTKGATSQFSHRTDAPPASESK